MMRSELMAPTYDDSSEQDWDGNLPSISSTSCKMPSLILVDNSEDQLEAPAAMMFSHVRELDASKTPASFAKLLSSSLPID